MFRSSVIAAGILAGAAVLLPSLRSVPVSAQVPNRVYGTVTLDGAAAPVGTPIQAQVAGLPGKICGAASVGSLQVSGTSYPFQMDLPSGNPPEECKPGAVVIFLVGSKTAGQTFTLSDLGSFQRLDLTAPGTPNIPAGAISRTVSLVAGCTDMTSGFPDGATPQAIAAAASPAVVTAIWRFDSTANAYLGWSPDVSFASNLTSVRRGDALKVCASGTGTLNQPA
jgi:hypothetical protein